MDSPKLSEVSIEELVRTLYHVGTALCAARKMIGASIGNDESDNLTGIEALIEKAGFLTDDAIARLTGKPAILGGYDEWCGLARANRNAMKAYAETA
jgi:hypothetical protein